MIVIFLNYSDIGQRKGNYPNLVALPATLGNEVAGTIVAIGPNVTTSELGTRVVSLVESGYAEYAVAYARNVIPLPDEVSYSQAIVLPIQGQTAYLLLDKAAHFQKGERILIHAASGGVGSLSDEATPFVTQMLIPKCFTVSGYNTVVQPLEDQMRASQALLHLIAAGQIKVILDQSFPLAEAAAAHLMIEEKKTRGKVLLTI